MGQGSHKHRQVHCRNSQENIKRPTKDMSLIFLVASEKKKLSNERNSTRIPPMPPTPKLRRKRFRTSEGRDDIVSYPEKNQHPTVKRTNDRRVFFRDTDHRQPDGQVTQSIASSSRNMWLSSVPSRDAIPETSKVIIMRKVNLPSEQVGSFIDDIPEPKKIFVLRKGADEGGPGPSIMAKVHLEGKSSPVQGAPRDKETPIITRIQFSLPGQSTSQTLPSARQGQSPKQALPWLYGTKMVDRSAFITQLEAQMGSKKFQERIGAIDKIVDTCSLNPAMVAACILPICENIRSRLVESNRIVNLHMLMSLEVIIPKVKDSLPRVANLLIPAIVDHHLNSKNPDISRAALVAIQALVHNLDNALLVQILANKAREISGQAKIDLTNTVADMVEKMYSQKPKKVEKYVLPLLWHMLGVCNYSPATGALVRALHSQMGPKLRMQADSQRPSIIHSLDHLLHTLYFDFIRVYPLVTFSSA